MRSTRTASSSLLLPVLAVALAPVLVACGDDDSTGTAPAAPTVEVAGEPAVDPVTEPADPASVEEAPVEEASSGPSGEEAVAFFRSTEADCAAFAVAVGNDVLPAYYFDEAVAVQDLGNGSWVVADGSGVELVVDLSARVVHGLDGPTGVLPIEYSFGCPEDLYLGSLAE